MDESHQATWKRVQPVLLTTLVPVLAALGFFALATYAKKGGSVQDQPSMAAFDACLTANNLQPAQSYASQFDAQIASQQEMKACGNKVPSYVIKKWQQQAEAAQASYRECVENLGGSGRSGGFGRFHSGPSSGFRSALAACRSLIQGSGGSGGSGPPVTKKNAPGPVA
jgi:hypothetical protein